MPTKKSASATNGVAKTPSKPRTSSRLSAAAKYNLSAQNIDRTRWRLIDDRGCQRWKYLVDDEQANEWPQSFAEKYFLGLPTDAPLLKSARTPLDSIDNALSFFEKLQLEPGNWACEYGGPMFLLPGIVITWYVTEVKVPEAYQIEIANYLYARQNPDDGGWGLHIEGQSTVLGTALNYTTLRLVGQDAEDPRMVKARSTLHKLGGAVQGPHWTKFWLTVLGVCEWEAVNPCPPEMWLLPDWVPVAPWRWWVHIRQVFLPMSYIYSRRFQYPLTPLTESLRSELYVEPYASLNFAAHRNSISPRDNFHPKSWLLNTVNWAIVNIYLPYLRSDSLKQNGEEWAYELIKYEDENSDYACLGPVNGPMNLICRMLREGKDSTAYQRHVERLEDFMWVKSEGMLTNGTNGVQSWDTAFLIQAAMSAGVADQAKWRPMLTKALEFLEDQQMLEECRDQHKCYRHTRKGAWGFSTRDQGYTVSDCTAEAVKSVLLLQRVAGYPQLISEERIKQAIDVLLTMQNASGGFSSYEPTRGNSSLVEMFNAAEVFSNIMVEYDYPECTTAVVTALSLFTQLYPDYRAAEIAAIKARALTYIRKAQRPDGSWYGSWGICFTYAGMFALESLASIGETYANSERVRRGCQFFLDRQSPEDGGWGESYRACETGEWCEHTDGSQVVNTAWACIALLEAEYPEKEPVAKALRMIVKRQAETGEWLQEGIEGVFNKSCMISYPNYKFVFPIKALGMFAKRWGNDALF